MSQASKQETDLTLDDLVGLSSIKKLARIKISSCIRRRAVFPHCILHGVGGTGKTSLARAIGFELGYHFVEMHGADLINRSAILAALRRYTGEARSLRKQLLLFIDEVHRLSTRQQEAFYVPMVEWKIPSTDKDFANTELLIRPTTVSIAPFSFFAATTRMDKLDANSFIGRFPIVWEIEPYSECHIQLILSSLFRGYGFYCHPDLVEIIAKRCFGIPRTASKLASSIRDYAVAMLPIGSIQEITRSHIRETFRLEGIDSVGLTLGHRKYLRILMNSSSPRGVANISSELGQPEDVLTGTIEPVLSRLHFIQYGPRGREITPLGREHLISV